MNERTNRVCGSARNTAGLSRSAENGDTSRAREPQHRIHSWHVLPFPGHRLHTRSGRSHRDPIRKNTPADNFQVNYFPTIRAAKWRLVHSCHLVHLQSCVSRRGSGKNSHLCNLHPPVDIAALSLRAIAVGRLSWPPPQQVHRHWQARRHCWRARAFASGYCC